MRPRSLPLIAVVLLLALAAVAAVPVADARAPPTPVCGVCSVDTTVDGAAVAAGESELTVSIHENGTTAWEARVELTAGSDVLAENGSLRRAVVDEAMGRSIADPEQVRSQMGGEALIVRYRDDGATERHVGAVVFTPLTPEGPSSPFAIGGEGPRYLGTDRFTLRAPAGYDLHGDAESTDSGTIVWTRENGSERTSLDVATDPVAVESDSGAPGVRTWFARLLT
ncbi:hypothetical protein [Halolamina salifodinae]|uniref:Uncharacterized protein n=1 Tax=Halolamina salifodinae TaxID=1202767 RepID=A0A8T4GTE6_9EURY|nr:hypothetical protein [Halolamina salifodinae]MBP1985670.1 hypothetical protein [Halolamina salifodinae]